MNLSPTENTAMNESLYLVSGAMCEQQMQLPEYCLQPTDTAILQLAAKGKRLSVIQDRIVYQTQALSALPDSEIKAGVYVARGGNHFALGLYELALRDVSRGIELCRKLGQESWKFYLTRSKINHALGRLEDAELDAGKADVLRSMELYS